MSRGESGLLSSIPTRVNFRDFATFLPLAPWIAWNAAKELGAFYHAEKLDPETKNKIRDWLEAWDEFLISEKLENAAALESEGISKEDIQKVGTAERPFHFLKAKLEEKFPRLIPTSEILKTHSKSMK